MACDYEAKSFYKATLSANVKSSPDVFSTIRSVIQPLIPAALSERHNPPRYNIKSFLRDDGIAVLGIPPTGSEAVAPRPARRSHRRPDGVLRRQSRLWKREGQLPVRPQTTVETDPTFPNTSPRTSGSEALRPLTEIDFEELGLPPR